MAKSIEIGFAKEGSMFFSDYDLLKIAINFRPKESGFDVDEMMKRLRLINALEKQAKQEMDVETITDAHLERKMTVEFEDADYEKMKSLVKSCQWGIVAQAIINLYEKFK